MQNLRILACVVAALGSLTAAGCGSDNDCDNDDSTHKNCLPPQGAAIVVQNNSGFAVTEIHVKADTPTGWGPNLIVSGTALASGASLTIAASCGSQTLLLVDAAGEQCTITADLCASNAAWIIGKGACSTFTKQGTGADGSAAASGAAN